MTPQKAEALRLAILMAARSRDRPVDKRMLKLASAAMQRAGWYPRESALHYAEAERLFRMATRRERRRH